MRRNLALTLSTVLAVGIAAAATATPSTACRARSALASANSCGPSPLELTVGGEVLPKKLPTHKMAPVAVEIGGKLSTVDGSQPPASREATIDFDRNGSINATGLPVCKRSRLEANDTRSSQLACRGSIVGTGLAHVAIESAGNGPIPIPLTFFNGGVRGDTTTLFIQPAITVATPAPTVVTVKLTKIAKGPFGLQAVAKIPMLVGEGSLLDFSFKINRFFKYKGATQSYATARCPPDGLLSARFGLSFSTGEMIRVALAPRCTQHG